MAKKQNKIPYSYHISQFKNPIKDQKYEDDRESGPNNLEYKDSMQL